MQRTGAEGGATRPRRLLLLLLAFGALLAVHAAGLTFTVQDRSVAPNGTAVVSILIADAQDIGGADMVVTYDPAVLRFESASAGSLAANDQVRATETGPGRIAFTLASPRSLTGTGPIATLTFVAVGAAGARSQVALESVTAVTVDGDSVPAQVANGTVSVGGGPQTPLSPFGAVGALAVAGASLRRVSRSRSRP
ncbi:MAG: cohesin domain-containing protein [Methanospirillum sp.]